MVKQILAFLRWQIDRLKWHDYVWYSAAFTAGATWSDQSLVFYTSILVIISMIIGSLINLQWQRWKLEREELLNTIKNSK